MERLYIHLNTISLVKSIFITLPLNIATNEQLVGILVYGTPVYLLLIDFMRHIGAFNILARARGLRLGASALQMEETARLIKVD